MTALTSQFFVLEYMFTGRNESMNKTVYNHNSMSGIFGMAGFGWRIVLKGTAEE